jgi:hypothetical protein
LPALKHRVLGIEPIQVITLERRTPQSRDGASKK